MKYLKQFLIILAISFTGEALHHFLTLPVPGSIYGILILFTALLTGILKTDQIKDTSSFLIEIMPAMFIPAAVGLIDVWELLADKWLQYLLIIILSTILVMTVSGLVTQFVVERRKR